MIFPLLLLFVAFCNAYPEQGRFEYNFKFEEKHNKFAIPQPIFKSMFKKTDISLQVYCKSKSNFKITVNTKSAIIICKNKTESDYLGYLSEHNITCHDNEYFRNDLRSISGTPAKLFLNNSNSFLTTSRDGFYWLNMTFTTKSVSQPYDVKVKIDTKSWYGMLSGRDWPLLIFYSIMCGIYSIFALIWLVFSCRNWRDLLRIQFWIGGVILLGMLEKAMFVSEFQAINNSGIPLKYPMLTAEIVSCVKRMLARILLMIVCIGYGIVKQRLGPAMKKIIGVGVAYLLAALVEGYFRVLKPELIHSKYTLIPELVLVILDAIILWWSFSYLIETIKQMRMKHNVVKFNLYRHFSNILIIVVVASAVFMIWALYVFKSTDCLTHWKEMWLNEAYWHILFSIVLLTIMILWRPSKNSQRYAYSPLLDADDDLDEEDDDNIIMDNMTSGELRKPSKEGHQKKSDKSKTMEDELRWIEDNIPASAAEKIYPLVDSDSEITPSKLTAGKMD